MNKEIINTFVSTASDEELTKIISSLNPKEDVETLIKCDENSLQKIYRIKRENVEELVNNIHEETPFGYELLSLIAFLNDKKELSCDDGTKEMISKMVDVSDEIKNDNERCKSDIQTLEQCLVKMKENLFMYREDLDDESLKICNDKIEETEGLLRVRSKTLHENTKYLCVLNEIVQRSRELQ